jgi:DNA-binding transcriptional ArsR family regulator
MTRRRRLNPTLWRTCRVLANHRRLRHFAVLTAGSPQAVAGVAERLGLRAAVASQCLRALESRGLLRAHRVGRRVLYGLNTGTGGAAPELVAPLRAALGHAGAGRDAVFRLATAFTHPRRIAMYRALAAQPRTVGQLRAATGISWPALWRHLRKLEARGFVRRCGNVYRSGKPPTKLGRVLAGLATD